MQTNVLSAKTRFLLLLQVIALAVPGQEGQTTLDSLKKALNVAKDTARINILNDISCGFYGENADSVLYYAQQAYNESKQINYSKGLSVALVRSRVSAQQKGDLREVERFLSLQIPLSLGLKDYNGVVNSYEILAGSFLSRGMYQEALETYDLALKYVPLTYEDCRGLGFRYTDPESHYAVIYASKGSIYKTIGDYEKAYAMLKNGVEVSKKVKDTLWYANRMYWSLSRLGYFFEDIGEFESAAQYFQQADKFGNETYSGWDNQDYFSKARTLYNREKYDSALYCYHIYLDKEKERLAAYGGGSGDSVFLAKVYIGTKKFDSAVGLLQRYLTQFQASSKAAYELSVLALLPKAYLGKNDNAKALSYANLFAQLAQKIGVKPKLRDAYQLLAEIYEQKGDKNNANLYYRRYAELKDELKTDEFKQKLKLYKAEEEEKRKTGAIKQLEKEKQWLSIGIIMLAISLASIFGFVWLQKKYNSKKRLLREKEIELKQAEDERRMASLEMMALRSQMNPHFIFNCLNSINRFVLRNDNEAASNYLTKFSKLMRMVLENSKQALIPLEEEVKCLELYIQMEQFRCKNAFTYYIKYHDAVNTEEAMIPPLLLQPFVENAIWHGLNPKEGDGRLGIEFFQKEDALYCIIKDNGIGRKKASELKSLLAESHKSLGLEITKDRLSILGDQQSKEPVVEVEDLHDENGMATGTKVLIKIYALPAFEDLRLSLNL